MVIDRGAYDDATTLVDEYGFAAIAEAVDRAEASRRRDNPIRFARWRAARRTIVILADPQVRGTIH